MRWYGQDTKDDDDYNLLLHQASTIISLHELVDAGVAWPLNDPAESKYFPRKKFEKGGAPALNVRCQAREVVHGTQKSVAETRHGWEPRLHSSLLVYDVHLNPNSPSQRITEAVVEFEFISTGKTYEVPQVISLAPANWSSSSVHEGGLKPRGASVVGSIWCNGDGQKVMARWRLLEEEQMPNGVPGLVRCIIILARPTKRPFQTKITVKANLDGKVGDDGSFLFSGKTPPDNTFLFEPKLPLPATSSSRFRPQAYDLENLEKVNIKELA